MKSKISIHSNASGVFLTIDGRTFDLTHATPATLSSVAIDLSKIAGIA